MACQERVHQVLLACGIQHETAHRAQRIQYDRLPRMWLVMKAGNQYRVVGSVHHLPERGPEQIWHGNHPVVVPRRRDHSGRPCRVGHPRDLFAVTEGGTMLDTIVQACEYTPIARPHGEPPHTHASLAGAADGEFIGPGLVVNGAGCDDVNRRAMRGEVCGQQAAEGFGAPDNGCAVSGRDECNAGRRAAADQSPARVTVSPSSCATRSRSRATSCASCDR